MERQQHTNPWAEKLLQVSMPDSGEAWTAMETILDGKMPQIRTKDRRRWVLLILSLLLLIGVCNCPGRGRFFHNLWTTTTTTHKPAPAETIAPPATRGGDYAKGPNTAGTITRNPASPVAAAISHPSGSAHTTRDTNQHTTLHAAPNTTPHAVRRRSSKHNSVAAVYPAARVSTAWTPASGTITGGSENPSSLTSNPHTGAPTQAPAQQPPATANATANPKANIPAPGHAPKKTAPGDSTHKKPSPKPQDQPPPEKQHGWMIGIGLNQFFPIGGQQGSTFNSNGLTGTLTDYLPVPMIRYYVNPRLYVQLEAQINTPQAAKKNVVISSPQPDTSTIRGSSIVSTTSLRQLYYFNVPLSVHFQPWQNVDIGTGLQFSHLSNAIGDFDSTSTNSATSAVSNAKAIKSFKGATLYQHLKTSEFRVLLDASYTYKHFIFGLRYNQALSDFVNIRFASGQVTQSRNSSLQLYLRYILFDSRKKKGNNDSDTSASK